MQFKKLAAIAGSALMAGLTIAGPVLATTVNKLEKISDMVSVTDSTVSFPIFVIGEKAAPADVAGAVDVAVNMAANSKTTSSVSTTIAGETVTGGAKISTTGVYLTPYANPQNVKGIITASDIPSLLTGATYSSASGGSYQYKQYLYLLGDTTNSAPSKLTFERPTTENSPRITFKTPASSKLWTYKLTFSTPVSLSGVSDDTTLKTAIQGTTINMLGKDFIISDAAWSSGISSLTLLGGKNVVTVETGTPKTITSDSKDYTVTLTGVAAQTVGTSTYYSAIGDVNGESFTLKAGETKTLADGTLIAAIKVFQGKTGAADYATIAIGADKITLTSAGTVTKGTTVVPELTSTLTSSSAGGWSVIKIDYTPSVDAWMSAGGKVTDVFASTFDIKFNSIIPDFTDSANRQTITVSPSAYNLLLTYKNAADAEKQMYTLYYDNSGPTWRWASAPVTASGTENSWRDVVFDEGSNVSAVDQDFFVIQKGGFSHTLQYTSYTAATKTHTFTDESGNSVTAVGATGLGGASDYADLIVDGNTYKVRLISNTTKVVNIDLNGDGYIAQDATFAIPSATGKEYSNLVPKLITTGQGGLYFYKGNQTTGALTSGNTTVGLGSSPLIIGNSSGTYTLYSGYTSLGTFSLSATTAKADTTNYLDYILSCGASTCTVYLGTTTNLTDPGFVLVEEAQQGGTAHNWIYLPVEWYSTGSRVSVKSTTYTDDTNPGTTGWDVPILGTSTEYKGMTTYGSLVSHLSNNLGGSATISYPDVFTYGNLYVMTPTGTISSGGVGGQVTTDKVLPITSDVVKLDSELTSSDKQNYDLIIVGGPCINKLAAEALDKTYPACGAESGIPTNAGLIKLVADKFATGKTALLIAGWEAGDTDLAARIVQTGFPGATAAQKAGSEVTVTGTVASPSYS